MDSAERAARERLDAFFRALDRLTPDELARIGFRPAPEDERDALRDAIDEAATRTGRVALVDEAREAAIAAVTSRYSAGSFHPTFVGLNWGLSQGTVEDRVAIAATLADAAAAIAVEDALDPDLATAAALDAASITGMARGEAYAGSLAHALRDPDDPELRIGPRARRARGFGLAVAIATAAVTVGFGAVVGVVAGIAAGVRSIARRGSGGSG